MRRVLVEFHLCRTYCLYPRLYRPRPRLLYLLPVWPYIHHRNSRWYLIQTNPHSPKSHTGSSTSWNFPIHITKAEKPRRGLLPKSTKCIGLILLSHAIIRTYWSFSSLLVSISDSVLVDLGVRTFLLLGTTRNMTFKKMSPSIRNYRVFDRWLRRQKLCRRSPGSDTGTRLRLRRVFKL